jgi:hypothetical protein
MAGTYEPNKRNRLSHEQLGREITQRLLAAKAHNTGTFQEIARREWAILPLAERDLLTAIAYEAYPEPDDFAARQALTRYALVANHIRSQVEQTAILETLFTGSSGADDNEAVPPQS